MTDLLAALPPKPFPVENRPAPGSGLENTPGLEDDHVDTGQFWSTDEGPTFAEFLDIINPLQHIPVVSTLYRAITGDDIGTGPRVAGGMLFGGPIGALVAGVTALFEEASGGDIGEHIAEFINDFTGGDDDGAGSGAGSVAGSVASDVAGAQDVAAAKTNVLPANAQADIGAGIGAEIQTGAVVQQAAALAGAAMTPTASQLNRIAVNPGAAMGAVQGAGPRSIPGSVQNKALMFAPTAANVAFPARPMAMPFSTSASINPASANSRGLNQPGPAGPAGGTAQQAATRTTIAAPQVSNAVTRSQRQQADLMLAQWAAQQMGQQNGTPAAPAKKDDTPAHGHPDSRMIATAATAAMAATAATGTSAAPAQAHPMLPPRNASPEWYAQAMDQALNRYRNGASAGAGAGAGVSPVISLRR